MISFAITVCPCQFFVKLNEHILFITCRMAMTTDHKIAQFIFIALIVYVFAAFVLLSQITVNCIFK